MFCLRNWITILVFLTNAPPIYVLLFLTGQYVLQRPCVYCSILLFVLVFSLFDFHADWFEPRWQPSTMRFTETASSLLSGNATITEVLGETAGFAISALNGTGGSLTSAALEGVKRRAVGESPGVAANGNGFEWLRSLLEKRQFRIPCVDVIVRL
ncbi:hypothetical protein LTR37_010812 [Vermiconidia calcicola]|uniref:Uncharacterized protein n=1 Tax=Vermiconidia calcicola TaxID=1690605 RepID=A0ACC3N3Z5_9PEZI|nr:hypothetical protein LTR37_010812 [Vermiconidia calcicola]